MAFDRHLYQPRVYLKSDLAEVRPVPLNEGERDFVLNLKTFYEGNKPYFADKELYLLRNQSRRGVGFFEEGGFYPDFILWLLSGDKQFVSFVDPKGLRNLGGLQDRKIQFYQKIKELQDRLGDPNMVLNSFILSTTPLHQIQHWEGGIGISDLEARNVFHQTPGNTGYIRSMLNRVITPSG